LQRLQAQPDARIVDSRADYLRVQYMTPVMNRERPDTKLSGKTRRLLRAL
jgi:hypothetical protein